MFPLFGAFYYWFPQVHRPHAERDARRVANFWLFFIGFNVTFFPMHHARPARHAAARVDLSAGMGWDGMNLDCRDHRRDEPSRRACCSSSSTSMPSYRHGAIAGADPWGAGTLEWSTASPCRRRTTSTRCPSVHGRDPLWESGAQPTHVSGLAAECARSAGHHCARRDARSALCCFRAPSIWPFISAAGDYGAVHRLDLFAVGGGVGPRCR